ncbi:MAG: V-type ATP synthase subunit F [Candidatus Diapherotrites archaeon]
MEGKAHRRQGWQGLQIAVLGSNGTVTGFRLAGIKNAVVAEESQPALLRQFESLAAMEGAGILIVDDSCSQIRKEIILFIEANRSPIIIEIPGRGGKHGSEIIDSIVKRASGAN